MIKTKLETFIKKYSLSGLISEVRWIAKDKTLKIEEMTSDKKLLASVVMNNFDGFADSEFVVPDTLSLKSKINPLNDEIKITLVSGEDDENRITSLNIEDDRNTLVYHTGEEDHLPPKPKILNIPNYEVEIKLTERFVDDYLKAKTSFNDVNLFTLIMSKKKKRLEMVLGYSSNINTNRFAIDLDTIEGKSTINSPISFSAGVLKEILVANSEINDPILRVSEQGLAYIEFVNDDFISKYYMIKIPVED